MAAGVYTLTDELQLPRGHTLRGSGMDLTVLAADPAGFPLAFGGRGNSVINAGDPAEPFRERGTVEDMTLDAAGAATNALGYGNFVARRVRLINGICHGGFIAGTNAEITDSIISDNAWPHTLRGETVDCRDAGGLERGAGIYLPVWAVGPTAIERNVFERNNGADLDCDASAYGRFVNNVIRSSNGPAGMILYQCHRWVVEGNRISLPPHVEGWGGPWCFPASPGRHAAAIMGCLSQDLRIVGNTLDSYYALALRHNARLSVSENTVTGLVSNGGSTDSSLRNATITSQSVPSSVRRGTTFTVEVTLQNTGYTTWQQGWYLLGDALSDGATWGVQRVSLPTHIPPGSTVALTLTLKAPTRTGTYTLRYRLLEETVAWFGASLDRSIRVIR
jgi:hypothetical protein